MTDLTVKPMAEELLALRQQVGTLGVQIEELLVTNGRMASVLEEMDPVAGVSRNSREARLGNNH